MDSFKGGNVAVRAISSNELIIEGQMDEEKGSGKSKRSFKRCFYLPGAIEMKEVTSAMSSDGILTVIAPKRTSSMQQVDDHGNVQELEVSNTNPGTGSSWQQEHEESTQGDGFSSRIFSKTYHSSYSSKSPKY